MNRAVLTSAIALAAVSISAPAQATITTVDYAMSSVVNGSGAMTLDFDTSTSIYTLKTINLTIEDPLFFRTFLKPTTILLQSPSYHLYGSSYEDPLVVASFTLYFDPSLTSENATATYWTYSPTGETAYENTAPFTISRVPAVPEPATWAMMLLGFAGIGFALRRRKMMRQVPQLA